MCIQANYSFILTARDSVHNASLSVVLVVTDVNDNAPVFEQQEYNASVREGTAIGHEVVRLSATDRDGDSIKYTLLSGNNSGAFEVDEKTGSVRVAQLIDADALESPRLVLLVAATDGLRIPAFTATATLQVHVLNVNDNAPELVRAEYEVDVKEGTAVGEEVVRVVATDRDGDPITYVLLPGKDSSAFAIDESTGTLRVAQVL